MSDTKAGAKGRSRAVLAGAARKMAGKAKKAGPLQAAIALHRIHMKNPKTATAQSQQRLMDLLVQARDARRSTP